MGTSRQFASLPGSPPDMRRGDITIAPVTPISSVRVLICWANAPMRGAVTATEIFVVFILADVIAVVIWQRCHRE